MTRIFYFCPDFPQPSGGTRTLYRHVMRLREAGFDAAIVHRERDFRLTWHHCPAPVIWLADRPRFEATDILVFPEVMPEWIQQTRHFAGRRVVIALSWLPSYARLQPGARWQDFGIHHAITTSPAVQRHLTWSMEIPVTLIPECIDAKHYVYQPGQKVREIAYLTRKDNSGEWLQGTLTRRGRSRGWRWVPLRNLDETTYAQALQRATIYLATTLQEGLHVSVLEAMACGCLVVGYTGIGGKTYMVGGGSGQNCVLVENGNLLQLGQTLEQVLATLEADAHRFDGVIRQALATVRPYQDPERERQALVNFFTGLAS